MSGSLHRLSMEYRAHALILFAAVVFPFMAQRYQVGLVNHTLILAVCAIALNVLMGLSGLISVGSAAILGIGAYTAATLSLYAGAPFLLTLFVCAAVGAVLGLAIGLPALRVQGIYLAIATLALHFVAIFALGRYQAYAVGPLGFVLPPARIANFELDTEFRWYFFIVTTIVLIFAIVENIRYSRFGRAWMLLRDAPIAAASQGISPTRYKLLAFVFSSTLTGFAGGLLAVYQSNVYIDSFTLELAIQFIAMIVIGGWGSTGGSIAGAFFVALMPTGLSSLISLFPKGSFVTDFLSRHVADMQLMIYGLLIIGFLIFEPGGLAAAFRRLSRWTNRRELRSA